MQNRELTKVQTSNKTLTVHICYIIPYNPSSVVPVLSLVLVSSDPSVSVHVPVPDVTPERHLHQVYNMTTEYNCITYKV